jgi:hypothetical protein
VNEGTLALVMAKEGMRSLECTMRVVGIQLQRVMTTHNRHFIASPKAVQNN